jgi:serine phosphatase RsbU (regulator of sigma subunit)
MPDKLVEWSTAIQMREGEVMSGDHYSICPVGERVLVSVVDGIGHGPEAAEASRLAVSILEAHAEEPLVSLFSLCHKELKHTRGVVMSLAIFDGANNSLSWLGVGNVLGRLLRADKTSMYSEEELLTYSGVVGHEMPTMLIFSVLPVFRGDVLILATDGVAPEFSKSIHIGRSAHQLANDILSKHSKGTDDALVIVAKYRKDQTGSE